MVILKSIERETVEVFFKEKPVHIVALICRYSSSKYGVQ